MNLFDKYKPKETEHTLSTGDRVTLRELTLAQVAGLNKGMLKGMDDQGKPQVDMDAALKVKNQKISMSLVSPTMSVEELEALGIQARPLLDEVYALIDPEAARAETEALENSEGN